MRHTVKLPDNITDEVRFWAAEDNISFDKWMAKAVERECTRRSLAAYAARQTAGPDSSACDVIIMDPAPGGENDNRSVSQG